MLHQLIMNFEPLNSPKERPFRQTSNDAHESVKDSKKAIQNKIVEALKEIKIGGTFHEIALVAKLTDSQIWKRLSEMEDIYNTGITRELPSGRKGIVWQLKNI